jgi:hypothetical protein
MNNFIKNIVVDIGAKRHKRHGPVRGLSRPAARPADPAAERARLAHNDSNRGYKRRKRLDLVQPA